MGIKSTEIYFYSLMMTKVMDWFSACRCKRMMDTETNYIELGGL
jgi:hypothetical protein